MIRTRSERGASLVEFAVVMPLFLLLLFGIMEAGWAFSQQVEVRNAAREGARLAVVDYGTEGEIISETCSRAPLSADRASVYLKRENGAVVAEVAQKYAPLTGILPFFDGLTISSAVKMRLERFDDPNGTPYPWRWTAVSGGNPGADAGQCP